MKYKVGDIILIKNKTKVEITRVGESHYEVFMLRGRYDDDLPNATGYAFWFIDNNSHKIKGLNDNSIEHFDL